jgi:predicted secreted protein
MTKILVVCAVAASLVACSTNPLASAPQGKKIAGNTALPPVAAGPASKAATLTWDNKGEMINLKRNGTVTVTLDSIAASGNAWRLSQIPDPTVLKVASHDYIPSAAGTPQGSEKWVFQAIGAGDVEVNMWYGKVGPAPLDSALNFKFIVSAE